MIGKPDQLSEDIKDTISLMDIFRKPDVPENEEYNTYLDDIILDDIERAKNDNSKA